jgi:hypothetical protein
MLTTRWISCAVICALLGASEEWSCCSGKPIGSWQSLGPPLALQSGGFFAWLNETSTHDPDLICVFGPFAARPAMSIIELLVAGQRAVYQKPRMLPVSLGETGPRGSQDA